jgi:hypothetical protein
MGRPPIVSWPLVMSSITTQVRPRTGSPATDTIVSVNCSAICAFWSSESAPSITRQLMYGV